MKSLVACALVLTMACGDDDGGADAAADAGRDAPADVGRDAPGDAPVDAPVDAPRDAPRDAPDDAPLDAPRDGDVDAPDADAYVDAPDADAYDAYIDVYFPDTDTGGYSAAALTYCSDYDATCTIGGAMRFRNAMECLDFYDGAAVACQSCLEEYLDRAGISPGANCPAATGRGACSAECE